MSYLTWPCTFNMKKDKVMIERIITSRCLILVMWWEEKEKKKWTKARAIGRTSTRAKCEKLRARGRILKERRPKRWNAKPKGKLIILLIKIRESVTCAQVVVLLLLRRYRLLLFNRKKHYLIDYHPLLLFWGSVQCQNYYLFFTLK